MEKAALLQKPQEMFFKSIYLFSENPRNHGLKVKETRRIAFMVGMWKVTETTLLTCNKNKQIMRKS